MAHICSAHPITKFQSGDANVQVRQRNADTLGCILGIDLSGAQGNRDSDCMYWQSLNQLIYELKPHCFSKLCVCPHRAVRQLSQRDDGKCEILTRCPSGDFSQRLAGVVPLPLGSDNHTGIEDQSHAINPIPEDSGIHDVQPRPRLHRSQSPHRSSPENLPVIGQCTPRLSVEAVPGRGARRSAANRLQ